MNHNGRYILDDDGNPVPEPDLLKWGEWLERNRCWVAVDMLEGGHMVATGFLGLDYNFALTGPPLLYETRVFEGKVLKDQWRYATKDEALEGHCKAVQAVRDAR